MTFILFVFIILVAVVTNSINSKLRCEHFKNL